MLVWCKMWKPLALPLNVTSLYDGKHADQSEELKIIFQSSKKHLFVVKLLLQLQRGIGNWTFIGELHFYMYM